MKNKIISKVHEKILLDIISDKLENYEEWIVNEYKYYKQFIYEDDTCYIIIVYSTIYHKIDFYNKLRNLHKVYTFSFINKYKLKKKLNELIEYKTIMDIDSILDFSEIKQENQEAENGEKE